MKITANDIKLGMMIEYKKELWEVLKVQHVKPGKGGAFNQVEMKSIKSGTKLNERFRSTETVEKASIEEHDYTFLYKDGEEFHFMDPINFNQIKIPKSVIGDKEKMLSENLEINVNFYDEEPISIILPNQIVCVVLETETAIKGQTVSSSYKPAVLNNGLKVQIPQFINNGDKIMIDTRTIEYVKKL